nr:MAG TPA: hypothetical protein [Caudoviricetes sp.]
MKLIDILVDAGDEPPLFGVHTKYLAMDPDGRVYGYTEMPTPGIIGWSVPDNLYSTDGRGCLIQIDRDDVDGQWQSAIITREQYEAALAAKNDGWIEWGGGECPVPGDTDVLIKCKSEGVWDCRRKQRADEVSWTHDDSALDVIAYRLHQPQEVAQTEAEHEADLNECIGHGAAPVWNGEGLPPVGCECEWQDKNTKQWQPVKVVYASEWVTVIREINKEKGDDLVEIAIENYGDDARLKFRPILSESELKREEAVKAITLTGWCQTAAEEIYDLIAAGKVPGMKLED